MIKEERLKKITKKDKILVFSGTAGSIVFIVLGIVEKNPLPIICGIGTIIICVLHLAWALNNKNTKPQ